MSVSGDVRSSHYVFEDLGSGVTFGRARSHGSAWSNSAIVDLGDATLAFDTSLTMRSADDLQRASVALTGRPISVAVNSHWHIDHVLGNQLLDDRPIYATQRTVEILLDKRSDLQRDLSPERIEEDLRQLEKQRRSTSSESGKSDLDNLCRLNQALLAESGTLKVTPPNTGFDGEFRLPGELDATLLSVGSGHTESDAVLFLGGCRILCAGDLVVAERHPTLASGDPKHWLAVLDQLEELRPERIVTGHGPSGTVETIRSTRDYLETVLRLASERGEPEIPSRFRSWEGWGLFEANIAFVRSRLLAPRS